MAHSEREKKKNGVAEELLGLSRAARIVESYMRQCK
ncbi:hypothetical protein TorRG33x02_004010 [Trema orientale]|uniref:Uncharacterized protein n=1 Tax=Trema orientale TaxID=63057 RepID=A0A2P5G253_TREOI|nr:hypothetical protein TorRG33x02_004010 [Trema orientale]